MGKKFLVMKLFFVKEVVFLFGEVGVDMDNRVLLFLIFVRF